MAWNTISDIRHNCRECNRYRIMNPQDLHRKSVVLNELSTLQQFFEKKIQQLSENPNPPLEPAIVSKQNRDLCLQLIQECQQCDRVVDRVNKEIILLR